MERLRRSEGEEKGKGSRGCKGQGRREVEEKGRGDSRTKKYQITITRLLEAGENGRRGGGK